MDSWIYALGHEFRDFVDCAFAILYFRHWTLDFVLGTLGFGLCALDFELGTWDLESKF